MYVITRNVQTELVVQKSRFLTSLYRVSTEIEAQAKIKALKKEYWDANHNCTAYIVGIKPRAERSSDDGEPAGTAGAPMLEVLRQKELYNVVAVVTRYFGGIKLGTSGLIQAYKAAAIEAIQAARIIEKTVDEEITFFFEYPFMNSVMRIVKEEEPSIVRQGYEHDCSMTLRIRKGSMPRLKSRLEKVETLRFEDDGE